MKGYKGYKFTKLKEQKMPKQTSPRFGESRIPVSSLHKKNELLRQLYFGTEGIDYFYF